MGNDFCFLEESVLCGKDYSFQEAYFRYLFNELYEFESDMKSELGTFKTLLYRV